MLLNVALAVISDSYDKSVTSSGNHHESNQRSTRLAVLFIERGGLYAPFRHEETAIAANRTGTFPMNTADLHGNPNNTVDAITKFRAAGKLVATEAHVMNKLDQAQQHDDDSELCIEAAHNCSVAESVANAANADHLGGDRLPIADVLGGALHELHLSEKTNRMAWKARMFYTIYCRVATVCWLLGETTVPCPRRREAYERGKWLEGIKEFRGFRPSA